MYGVQRQHKNILAIRDVFCFRNETVHSTHTGFSLGLLSINEHQIRYDLYSLSRESDQLVDIQCCQPCVVAPEKVLLTLRDQQCPVGGPVWGNLSRALLTIRCPGEETETIKNLLN